MALGSVVDGAAGAFNFSEIAGLVFANLRFKSQQNVPQGLRLASRELRKK